MSLFIQEIADDQIHSSPDPIFKIIVAQLYDQLKRQVLFGHFGPQVERKSCMQFTQYSPVQNNELNLLDFCWRFQISQDSFRISVSPSILRKTGNILKARSKRTYSQLCGVLKSLNQNHIFDESIFMMRKDWTACVSSYKKWKQNNPMQKSFVINLRKDMKILKEHLLKTLPVMLIYLDFPSPLDNYLKNAPNFHGSPMNAFKQLRDFKLLFERFRSMRERSTNLSLQNWKILEDKNFMESFFIIFAKNAKQTHKPAPVSYEQMRKEFEAEAQVKKEQALNKNRRQMEGRTDNNIDSTNVTSVKILDKVGEEISLSQEGQHSSIFTGIYIIKVNFSVNAYTQKCFQLSSFFNQPKQVTKQLVKKIAFQKQTSLNSFRNETNFLRFLRGKTCEYIAKYYCEIIDQSQLDDIDCFYLEVYKSNLRETLKTKDLPVDIKLRILQQIVSGISFLADNYVLHRDLKPGNILIDKKLNPKIIDFGSCCSVYHYQDSFKAYEERLLSTKNYHIPYHEVKNEQVLEKFEEQEEYNQHIFFDIYSIGQIILDIFNLHGHQSEGSLGQSTLGYLWYIAQRCKSENPDDRLSHDELLVFIDKITTCHELLTRM